MYDVLAPPRSGMAMASAMAFLISGCDAAGPGSNPQSVETGESPDSRMTYREGGVELSKTASDELADFVTATQFDVVLPMSIRLNSMNPHARDGLLKRISSARLDLDKALRSFRDAGSKPSNHDIRNLERANSTMEHLLGNLVKNGERRRSRDRGKRLIEKYPWLRELSPEQVRDVLFQALRKSSKRPDEANPWIPTSVMGDTADGDTCRMDCSITAAVQFGGVELVYAGGAWGCAASTIAFFPCFAFVTAIKYAGIASITWNLSTCTKKCN